MPASLRRGWKVVRRYAPHHPQFNHKTSRAVRWGGRSSAPSAWTPSPSRQLIWSPWDPRPPVPKMHRWRWSWGHQGYSGGGRPRRKEQGLAHWQPQDGGQDSISHLNNHGNAWISLRIFLKPYFYLFTEVIHIHYNKLGKHINKKKKISHLEYPYQAQPHLPMWCINLFCFM